MPKDIENYSKNMGLRCNMCEFCNDKKKKIENGYTYGRAYIKSTNYGYCYKLCYDNSGEEYGEGEFAINYCPICGRKLAE